MGVCFFHKALDWPAGLIPRAAPEKAKAVGIALVVDYGPGEGPSKLNIEKLSGERMTQRNWNTVLGVWERMKGRWVAVVTALTRRFAPPSPLRGEGTLEPKTPLDVPSPPSGERVPREARRVRGRWRRATCPATLTPWTKPSDCLP